MRERETARVRLRASLFLSPYILSCIIYSYEVRAGGKNGKAAAYILSSYIIDTRSKVYEINGTCDAYTFGMCTTTRPFFSLTLLENV